MTQPAERRLSVLWATAGSKESGVALLPRPVLPIARGPALLVRLPDLTIDAATVKSGADPIIPGAYKPPPVTGNLRAGTTAELVPKARLPYW